MAVLSVRMICIVNVICMVVFVGMFVVRMCMFMIMIMMFLVRMLMLVIMIMMFLMLMGMCIFMVCEGQLVAVFMAFSLMMMPLIAGDLFLAVNEDVHMSPRDPAFAHAFPHVSNAGQAECVQFCDKGVRIGKQFEKGSRQHVAGSAHAAVKV